MKFGTPEWKEWYNDLPDKSFVGIQLPFDEPLYHGVIYKVFPYAHKEEPGPDNGMCRVELIGKRPEFMFGETPYIEFNRGKGHFQQHGRPNQICWIMPPAEEALAEYAEDTVEREKFIQAKASFINYVNSVESSFSSNAQKTILYQLYSAHIKDFTVKNDLLFGADNCPQTVLDAAAEKLNFYQDPKGDYIT